jgi:phosphate transport system substrate-binding protein
MLKFVFPLQTLRGKSVMFRHRFLMLILAFAALSPISCSPSNTVTIQSAGATFPAPLYKRWFLEYYLAHPDVRVNYQAIGSGAGVSQLQEGLTDFAASDEALKKEKIDDVAKAISEREHRQVDLVQIPLTAGAVALCYNLPGNPDIKLPRKVYVGMALGEIKFWDDEAIQRANPDVKLPHQVITFVRRAESSGTTFVFTTHLNAIDDRWKLDKDRKPESPFLKTPDGPGAGKTPQWVVGIGGKGNSGVAALISQTPGSFGYLEAGYAELLGLKMAKLENHAGEFVEPTDENCVVALEEAKFNDVFGATIPDPKAKSAYPIVTFTWVIARKHYDNQRIGDQIRSVFSSCLEDEDGEGQSLSRKLGYVKLPSETLERARKAIEQINGKQE